MTQSGYSGHMAGLFEGISKAAQVAQTDLPKQFEQIGKAIQVAELQNQSEQLRKTIQAFGQISERYSTKLLVPELKGLEELWRSLGKPLELSRSSDLPMSPRDSIVKQALGIKSDLENLKELPLSKPRLNPARTIAPKQTPNLSQQAISQSHSQPVRKKSIFRPNAKLQRQVLIVIYKRLQLSQEEVIEWQPSAWLGKSNIPPAIRTGWSKAIDRLIKKGLVKRCDLDNRKFTHNRGNAKGPISLTSEGYQEAERLIQMISNEQHSQDRNW